MIRKHWFKVDNAGKFFSFTNKNKTPAVFRYSVTLKELVDEKVLQEALTKTLQYFSNFNSHLKKGLFWYYLETSDNIPLITKENLPICFKIYKDSDDTLFRVNYYNKRINFEVSHVLSDGRGSLSFFKCLIYKYLIIKHKLDNIEIESDSSTFEKNEDSFDKYYTKQKYEKPESKKIYKYKEKKQKEITYFEYHIETDKVLELAHFYNSTLTGLLLSVLICSYKEQMKEIEYNKTIKIDVPVDLRRFFKSSTTRNFFGIIPITYKFDSKKYDFNDVVKSVNAQLEEKMTLDQLKTRMNLMISFEKNWFARLCPIPVKNIVLKIADFISNGKSTSCLSNIGKITVDESLEKYIENFNILNATNELKMILCSYKNDLSIGIASKYVNNDIIKEFCRFFKKNGILGIINTNKENEDEEM